MKLYRLYMLALLVLNTLATSTGHCDLALFLGATDNDNYTPSRTLERTPGKLKGGKDDSSAANKGSSSGPTSLSPRSFSGQAPGPGGNTVPTVSMSSIQVDPARTSASLRAGISAQAAKSSTSVRTTQASSPASVPTLRMDTCWYSDACKTTLYNFVSCYTLIRGPIENRKGLAEESMLYQSCLCLPEHKECVLYKAITILRPADALLASYVNILRARIRRSQTVIHASNKPTSTSTMLQLHPRNSELRSSTSAILETQTSLISSSA